jgi:hypothetical protein
MADLTALRNQIRTRAVFAVSESSTQLERALKTTSPRDTGLMESRTTVQAQGLTATAKAATDYASFVKDGTRPHLIRPRTKKVLAFYWPKVGRQMFLPRVNHPGTRGNSWWDQGIAKWQDFLREGLRRAPNG